MFRLLFRVNPRHVMHDSGLLRFSFHAFLALSFCMDEHKEFPILPGRHLLKHDIRVGDTQGVREFKEPAPPWIG